MTLAHLATAPEGTPVSPAVQMRVMLLQLRAQGVPFQAAWATAFNHVKWPHDTAHRREWKKLFGGDETVELTPREAAAAERVWEVWRAAYEQQPATDRERPLSELAAVA